MKPPLYPIGTACYDWISGPFMAFKGEVVEHVSSKGSNCTFYRGKFFDTRFNSYYTTLVCCIYLSVEEAKKAHDEMEEILEKNRIMFEE